MAVVVVSTRKVPHGADRPRLTESDLLWTTGRGQSGVFGRRKAGIPDDGPDGRECVNANGAHYDGVDSNHRRNT
jgi:hypothetical protein